MLHTRLKECIARRPECGLGNGAPDSFFDEPLKPLPKRILDIRSSSDASAIYLVLSEVLSSHYMTLSHCWGEFPPLTTTLNSLPQRLSGIDMWELPKTFQDAVTITRNLNVWYLWIDSLCLYLDRHRTKYRGNLRPGPLFLRGFVLR
jgi:hypothetical protein